MSVAEASTSTLPRHDFFQSDEKFTLSIYVKGLKPDEVSVSFRDTSVRSPHTIALSHPTPTLTAFNPLSVPRRTDQTLHPTLCLCLTPNR